MYAKHNVDGPSFFISKYIKSAKCTPRFFKNKISQYWCASSRQMLIYSLSAICGRVISIFYPIIQPECGYEFIFHLNYKFIWIYWQTSFGDATLCLIISRIIQMENNDQLLFCCCFGERKKELCKYRAVSFERLYVHIVDMLCVSVRVGKSRRQTFVN